MKWELQGRTLKPHGQRKKNRLFFIIVMTARAKTAGCSENSQLHYAANFRSC